MSARSESRSRICCMSGANERSNVGSPAAWNAPCWVSWPPPGRAQDSSGGRRRWPDSFRSRSFDTSRCSASGVPAAKRPGRPGEPSVNSGTRASSEPRRERAHLEPGPRRESGSRTRFAPWFASGGRRATRPFSQTGEAGGAGGVGRGDPVRAFENRFQAAGGEVIRLADEAAARVWLEDFASEFESVSVCRGVPGALQPGAPRGPAFEGVAGRVSGSGSSGSDRLTSSFLQGRPPPPNSSLRFTSSGCEPETCTRRWAMRCKRAVKIFRQSSLSHSGPSKSADIGQILVTGVHGPGRIIGAILGADSVAEPPDAV